jgi:hypothetical protein
MEIRIHRAWGIVLCGLGAVNLALAMVTRSTLSLVSAGLIVTVGILMFVVAPVVIEDTQVRVKNLLGITLRTYRFRSLAAIHFDGSKVFYVDEAGQRQRIRGLSRTLADPRDWRRFEDLVRRAREERTGRPAA